MYCVIPPSFLPIFPFFFFSSATSFSSFFLPFSTFLFFPFLSFFLCFPFFCDPLFLIPFLLSPFPSFHFLSFSFLIFSCFFSIKYLLPLSIRPYPFSSLFLILLSEQYYDDNKWEKSNNIATLAAFVGYRSWVTHKTQAKKMVGEAINISESSL